MTAGDVVPLRVEPTELQPWPKDTVVVKPRMVVCYVCRGWIIAGTLGSRGCPHCQGAKV